MKSKDYCEFTTADIVAIENKVEELIVLNAELLAALKKAHPFVLWGGGPGTDVLNEIEAIITKTETHATKQNTTL